MGSLDRFLYAAESVDELPAPVSAAIQQHLQEQTIQGLLVLPPQQYPIAYFRFLVTLPFRWRITPQRTLAFGSGQVIVVAVDQAGELRVTAIPLEALTSIELTTVLLYAYVQFTWVEGDRIETERIEFNSVGERLIRKYVHQFRARLIVPEAPGVQAAQDAVEEAIEALPLKFRNYLRYALLPNERALAVAYQPALRDATGWRRPFISPNRTVAITRQHIVIVEDEIKTHVSYGITTRYFPVARIQSLTFEAAPEVGGMCIDSGKNGTTHRFRIPLEAASIAALQDVCSAVIPTCSIQTVEG